MTFWTDEKSVQDSQPVEIIDFACGSTHWRQCSGPLAVIYGGQTYSPQPGLRVAGFEDTGNWLRSNLEIETEWGNPLVALYPGTPPDAIVTVAIYRIQGANSSSWWSGYVADIRRKSGRKATIACVASLAALGTGSLALRCGRACQVPLYSSLCGVVQATYEVAGVVDGFSGLDVTSTTFATEADGYWVGGPITINGYGRIVLNHVGDTVTISQAIPGLAAGQALTVGPGCDHTVATCQSRFDNLLNYKGYPYLPTAKNPFLQGVY